MVYYRLYDMARGSKRCTFWPESKAAVLQVDNVCAVSTEYPNILATGGLHDPRVGYWEPAKYVAKLRHTKTDKNMLLFHCEMGAGDPTAVFSRLYRFLCSESSTAFAFHMTCKAAIPEMCWI